MQKNDERTIARILADGAWGAFGGMVVVGTVIWWDVSGIATMLRAADHSLLSNIFLGGAMAKGTLIGLVIGTARLGTERKASRDIVVAPAALATRP